jgi:hypothetical protein
MPSDIYLPLGFHLTMPLNNEVSCSSVQGFLSMSQAGLGVSLGASVGGAGVSIATASPSAVGVEAARATAFVFFLGGISERGFKRPDVMSILLKLQAFHDRERIPQVACPIASGGSSRREIALTRRTSRRDKPASMDDDEDKDPGEVFAIPDLYRPSRWLSDVQQPSSFLFSGLRLDGLQTPPY